MSPSDIFTPFFRRFTDEHARSISETRKLHDRVLREFQGSQWSRPNAVEELSTQITCAVLELAELPDHPPLGRALDTCQKQLLALESVIFAKEDVDFSKPFSLHDQVALNRHLRSREYFLAHQERIAELLVRAVGNSSAAVLKSLPPLSDSIFSVPLITLIPRPGEFLDGMMGIFFQPELREAGLFTALTDQLIANICSFSGIPLDGSSRKPQIWPSEANLGSEELVEAYLAGTPLHELLLTPCPFDFPQEQRFAGQWIVAPSGRGKTTLLHAMFLSDLDRDASIVVMDSKGDLIEPLKRLEWVKDRLLLVEPRADFAFALNPLDVTPANVMHAVNLIEYIMAGLLDAKFTALQTTLFRNVVPAIIEAMERPTLDTFRSVMISGIPEDRLPKLNPHARQFFENRLTGFHSKTYESTRKEVVWRLDYLMTNPVLRSMFSAVHTRLDMGKEMDAGKVILIDNSKAILTDEGAEFFGRFFIALIVRAAQQRSGRKPEQKKPCFVYIDECQTVIAKDTRIPTLLDECRSQKIALILAHQRTAQLTAPVLDAAANCAIRMANSDDEAKYLSDKLRMPVEVLRALPRGTFGTFVRDLTTGGMALKVPYIMMEKLPTISEEEMRRIRERMQAEFSFVPESEREEPAAAAPVPTAPEPPASTPDVSDAPSSW